MDFPLFVVDGWDTAEAGLTLDNDGSGWRDAPEFSYQTATWAGRWELLLLADAPTLAARRLVISAMQRAADMVQLQSYKDQLKRALEAPGPLRIAFGDTGVMVGERVFLGVLEKLVIEPIAPAFRQPVQRVKITILCTDPRAHDATETVVNFTAGPKPAPVGTAPSYPLLSITGPVVDPIVIMRDAEGVERLRMAFQVGLAAGQRMHVDCDRLRITDDAGVSRPEWLKAAPDFITLSPADSLAIDGPHPTLECTPPAALAEARYPRSWS